MVRFEEGEKAWQLTVLAETILPDLQVGESVSVNGCCLTVTEIEIKNVTFDIITETLRLTSFFDLRSALAEGEAAGSDTGVVSVAAPQHTVLVNLERSLRFDGKVGGHFVTGHVDGTGKIASVVPIGDSKEIWISVADNLIKYIVGKGSVAVDGVSLTVNEVKQDLFSVNIIRYTQDVTNLEKAKAGDVVNIECDIIGKYVERFVSIEKDSDKDKRLRGLLENFGKEK